jgi:large subunit ribosomal protein L29
MKDSFKDLTHEELAVKKEELKKAYDDVCNKSVIGHVDNPLARRTLRRKLARVVTLLHEHELGIRKR